MLYEYLNENYKKNEPIFVSDIELPMSATNLRQQLKVLCDAGKIKRYENGIYYLPGASKLKGTVAITPDTVARYKYVTRKGNVDGYYSGFTFANQMGLTLQVPYTIEIVSNAASANVREVDIKGRKVVIRKPKTLITKQNYRILQFLDLLKEVDVLSDEDKSEVARKLAAYVAAEKIRQADIDAYIDLYPDKIYKNLYEMRLYNAFA